MAPSRAPAAGPPRPPRAPPLSIVAIGASAGGLKACSKLFDLLPSSSGMAYVVIQHLDPTHESLLVGLLGAHTVMPVVQAADGMALRADRVHIIPPGAYLSVRGDTLLLTRPNVQRGARLPFDFLLHALAANAGPSTVAVVLSGSGTDGSLGAVAVRDAGGLVIAQQPDEAGSDGMPRSAIASGAVDQVLALAEIPAALARFANRQAATTPAVPSAETRGGDWLAAIVELLRTHTKQDFRLYKQGTLRRRIEQRMALVGIAASHLDRYHARLTTDAAERDQLAKDLLINVTSFFRDTKAFELLAAETIPALVREHTEDRPIRVWTVGCSTGEEAYSLAMLFLEHLGDGARHIKLQVFASDIDSDAVATAREGVYPSSIEAEVSPARLARFFIKLEDAYRIGAELRSAVIFTVQDVLSDPPFSRLDMVSCRNLLIYLQPEAQAKVVALFHFGLRNGGVLLLGAAETIGNAAGRFEVISKPARLYRQIGRSRPNEYPFALSVPAGARGGGGSKTGSALPRQFALAELCRRLVLEQYAPAAVLINARNECLFTLGPLDSYLRIPSGQPSVDLSAMARQETRTKLRAAIQQARKGDARVVVGGGRATHRGDITAFNIVAQPVQHDGERLLLICFVDQTAAQASAASAPVADRDRSRVAELEHELESSRAELQEAVRGLELADEDQKAITEETLSANEEYQSTNEELMTSKEELQSLNEELTALNGQLQETLERQRVAANDLQNVLYSTDVATLFLDGDLRIRLFTPATRALFNVIPSDVGRPLADLHSLVPDPDLLDDAARVLRGHTAIERELDGGDGTWLSRRVMSYRTQDKVAQGVVITFTDITERRRVAAMMMASRRQAELATRAKSHFLVTASHDLRQPLQTLTLLQEMLARKVQGEAAQKLIARLDMILQGMSGMLNALLDTNKIEAGIVTPAVSSFPINLILKRLHAEFLVPAQAKGLDVRIVPCSRMVTSDPELLEQMLRNLLGNALKYTRRGRILLGCRRCPAGLRIEVWDTGSGIPGAALQTIFEEYRQLESDHTTGEGGLGLGLSIVRRLGVILGHPITVRSRPGKGSVFAIEIALGNDDAMAAAASNTTPANRAPDGDRSARILLVEDDPNLRELLAAGLSELGHTVTTAADADEALLQAGSGNGVPPELILADFNLPNARNGLQVAAELRQRCGHGIPAIILTGDISTGTLRDIDDADCVRLTKPVRMRGLSEAVQRLLATARPAAPHPAVAMRAAGLGELAVLYVVDDDPGIGDAIRELFHSETLRVELFQSGEAFLEGVSPGCEACLLIDARLPGITGLEVIRRMRAKGEQIPSIVMTGHGDLPMAVRAMRAGAMDFIVKPISRADLRTAVNQALERTHDATRLATWRSQAAEHLVGLTERQREIMHLVLAGQPSKNIAADLGISQRTVENHRAAIMHKTGAGSLPALARLALAAAAAEDASAPVA